MTAPSTLRPFLRTWLLWLAGTIAFPIAGLAGTGVAGRVDDARAALIGGAVCGLVIGAGQTLASRRRLDPRRWIPATTIGMGAGLMLGAWAVGYGTSLSDLASMGALTGLVLGPAQALALPARATHGWMLGGRHTGAVGAGLDRHHSGRHPRGGPVHQLRPLRSHHLHRSLRAPPAPAAALPANPPAPTTPTHRRRSPPDGFRTRRAGYRGPRRPRRSRPVPRALLHPRRDRACVGFA